MRDLRQARRVAREERKRFAVPNYRLCDRLREELQERHGIRTEPATALFLKGSQGMVSPQESCLYFDEKLKEKPSQLLQVVAHEFGHVVLHQGRFRPTSGDLIGGSSFLQTTLQEFTRYSSHTLEEAEADAFAAEFLCSSVELFQYWWTHPGKSVEDLAAHFGVTTDLVRQQLMEGLLEEMQGEEVIKPEQQPAPNPEQEEAATCLGCPVLVDAGPGTGKTKTLVRRVQFLVDEAGVSPQNILILTYSNEATRELRERLVLRLGPEDASRLRVFTFHAFGKTLLKKLSELRGLSINHVLLDDVAQEELLNELLARVDCEDILDLKEPSKTVAEVVRSINALKDRLMGPDELFRHLAEWTPKNAVEEFEKSRCLAAARLYESYEQAKKSRHLVDFADLIYLPYQILSENPDLREKLAEEFAYVMVDEYQDVSHATAQFLGMLCGPSNPPWVVGDARQAIYRFRGAEPDNVVRFQEDFPDAKVFQLSLNYRASQPMVELANLLAGELEGRTEPLERWRAGRHVQPIGAKPVRLLATNCDAAELEALIETVQNWLEAGVPAEEIAVLARRNLDVRRAAVALKSHGIPAVTRGLLTSEGASGDLAGVLAAVDEERALPRLLYALESRVDSYEKNAALEELLNRPDQVGELGERVRGMQSKLREGFHSQDAWKLLCDFLFFHSNYLRRLWASADPETRVQLEEVVSTLALALQHRVSNPELRPRESRLLFGERLRLTLSQASPALLPPVPRKGAVRVMTCHASKGLEFPCVAVIGQSLPDLETKPLLLPPTLQPKAYEQAQADSLLFVAATRAQKSLVVSYAATAGGFLKSTKRKLSPLLEFWTTKGPLELVHGKVKSNQKKSMGRVWGGEPKPMVKLYALTGDACPGVTYLEDQLEIRLPTLNRPLYPFFLNRVCNMLRRVVDRARQALPLDEETLDQIHLEEWPAKDFADHPHLSIYRPRARRWMQRLADNYPSHLVGEEAYPHQLQLAEGVVSLPTVGHFRNAEGLRVAIILQIGNAPGAEVRWSTAKDRQRLPLVLLHDTYGDVYPFVLDAARGDVVPFRWAVRGAGARQIADRAYDKLSDIQAGRFHLELKEFTCDRCRLRIMCPQWMGALASASEQ